MLSKEARNQILFGLSRDVSDDTKDAITKGIEDIAKYIKDRQDSVSSTQLFGTKGNVNKKKSGTGVYSDNSFYTNLAAMINTDNRFLSECGDMLETLSNKEKKYYSIIKDYQIMDVLVPQINRVMLFLVNECISPDVQNKHTFDIVYNSTDDADNINKEIDKIRNDLGLDGLLRKVYNNRFKLGREYYIPINYNDTYDKALQAVRSKKLNESADASLTETIDSMLENLTATIDEVTISLTETVYQEESPGDKLDGAKTGPIEKDLDIVIDNLNIHIDRSPVCQFLREASSVALDEAASCFSIDNAFDILSGSAVLNEASYQPVLNNDKFEKVLREIRSKKIDRCMIRHLDAAKVFRLNASGRIIGYFYIENIEEAASKTVNAAKALKDRLLKNHVANTSQSFTNAENIICKQLSEKIIKTFDPNIGINRIEDMDLLHNYLISSGILNGNKRITFYYADDVYDMSRSDDSALTPAVLMTKLYTTLMLNNVMTKLLRGRGRQIHTVNMGSSPMTKKYVVNAMAALTMPENNFGTLHGSFEQLLNPLNSASDIVIPTDEGTERYIQTDYIEGQNVNMDDEFLRFLLNSIVSAFGLDPAVLDATNGNIQFAKTLSMESVQICILITNEQNDLLPSWSKFIKKCLDIQGSEKLKSAVKNGMVDVKFFSPKSLTLQMSVDEINNAKSHAEAIADVMPLFNIGDGPEIDAMRAAFIYQMITNNANLDWDSIRDISNDSRIYAVDLELQKKIIETIRAYKEHTESKDVDDLSEEDLQNEDLSSDNYGDDDEMGSDNNLPDESYPYDNTEEEGENTDSESEEKPAKNKTNKKSNSADNDESFDEEDFDDNDF